MDKIVGTRHGVSLHSIRLKEAKKLIGWITYGPLPYDERLKEIAYAIDPAYWNHGFATTAGKAFLQWLFKNVGTYDMYAQVNPKNHRSIRILEKLRMVKIKEDTIKRVERLRMYGSTNSREKYRNIRHSLRRHNHPERRAPL